LMPLRKRFPLAVVSLLLAGALYLPCVHLVFRPAASDLVAETGVAPLPAKLAAHQMRAWADRQILEADLAKMRPINAEWDLMGRSFLVWALGNMALRDAAQMPQALDVMDGVLDETLRLERQNGMYFFLMPYARGKPWVQQPARSLFLDGEIALMLAVRCVVQPKPQYLDELGRRVEQMVRRMEASPSLSAESYPDECWTFCNTTALAAVRVSDYLLGTDHSTLVARWVEHAKTNLIDPATGLLISAYTLDGRMIYPPEGSSIWHVSHCLFLLDESFGRQQYELAKQHLASEAMGFGFAREWPAQHRGRMDVDSGLVVPGLDASAASSGLAFVAAGTYGDMDFLRRLATTLTFAAFPVEHDGALQYEAGNRVGDAVILYGLTVGPVWQKVKRGRP